MTCREESRSDVGCGGRNNLTVKKIELGGIKYLLFPNSKKKNVFVMSTNYIFIFYTDWCGSTVVKVLCYKSEGRWFDPSWCQWISSLI